MPEIPPATPTKETLDLFSAYKVSKVTGPTVFWTLRLSENSFIHSLIQHVFKGLFVPVTVPVAWETYMTHHRLSCWETGN